MIPDQPAAPPWGRVIFAGSVFAFGVGLVAAYALMPDRVPVHFSASGDADRVVGRGTALVTFALFGAVIALLLGTVAAYTSRVSMTWLNIPHKSWWVATPLRERRVRTMLGTDLHLIGAATMLLLAGILLLVTGAARADVPRLSHWSWVLLGLYLAAMLGYAGYASSVRYRPATGTE